MSLTYYRGVSLRSLVERYQFHLVIRCDSVHNSIAAQQKSYQKKSSVGNCLRSNFRPKFKKKYRNLIFTLLPWPLLHLAQQPMLFVQLRVVHLVRW
jgi:hypothetical protein